MKIKSLKRKELLFYFTNQEEFEKLWENIFEEEEYKTDLNHTAPLIFDIGAHIGLATIYFKSKYPRAKILAFEPNPNTAKLLKLNIKANNLKGVKIIEAGVWDKKGKNPFYTDTTSQNPWTWGDSFIKNIWNSQTPPQTISVKTVVLSALLTKPIDLLKLDVEGAENQIIQEAAEKLKIVKNLILEYHRTPITNPQNKLSSIIKTLKKVNFKVTLVKKHGETLIKGAHES
jgi:FkbM family methyltransferase